MHLMHTKWVNYCGNKYENYYDNIDLEDGLLTKLEVFSVF